MTNRGSKALCASRTLGNVPKSRLEQEVLKWCVIKGAPKMSQLVFMRWMTIKLLLKRIDRLEKKKESHIAEKKNS